jgi:hypothetical protein
VYEELPLLKSLELRVGVYELFRLEDEELLLDEFVVEELLRGTTTAELR